MVEEQEGRFGGTDDLESKAADTFTEDLGAEGLGSFEERQERYFAPENKQGEMSIKDIEADNESLKANERRRKRENLRMEGATQNDITRSEFNERTQIRNEDVHKHLQELDIYNTMIRSTVKEISSLPFTQKLVSLVGKPFNIQPRQAKKLRYKNDLLAEAVQSAYHERFSPLVEEGVSLYITNARNNADSIGKELEKKTAQKYALQAKVEELRFEANERADAIKDHYERLKAYDLTINGIRRAINELKRKTVESYSEGDQAALRQYESKLDKSVENKALMQKSINDYLIDLRRRDARIKGYSLQVKKLEAFEKQTQDQYHAISTNIEVAEIDIQSGNYGQGMVSVLEGVQDLARINDGLVRLTEPIREYEEGTLKDMETIEVNQPGKSYETTLDSILHKSTTKMKDLVEMYATKNAA